MPEVWVSGYLPSALARSNYQCVLSSASDAYGVRGGHSVLTYQPLRGGRINKRQIDLVPGGQIAHQAKSTDPPTGIAA